MSRPKSLQVLTGSLTLMRSTLANPNNNRPRNNQANVTEENLAAIMLETNMFSNENEWLIDIGATCHICGDKNAFLTYLEIHGGEQRLWETHLHLLLLERKK